MELYNIIKVTTLSEEQLRQIDKLWDNEFPAKINGEFLWWMKRQEEQCHYIIEDEHGKVIAWTMVFNREEENLLIFIVAREYQQKGLGSRLMEKIKTDFPFCQAWAIDHDNDIRKDGSNYPSPVNFFVKHDFEVKREGQYSDEQRIKAVKIKWVNNN